MKDFIGGKNGPILIVGATLAIILLILVPLVLIFALRMMGAPVEYTMSAWVGAFILLSLVNTGSSEK